VGEVTACGSARVDRLAAPAGQCLILAAKRSLARRRQMGAGGADRAVWSRAGDAGVIAHGRLAVDAQDGCIVDHDHHSAACWIWGPRSIGTENALRLRRSFTAGDQ